METETFVSRDFEKKFFSEKTNSIFCQTFLENAMEVTHVLLYLL